MHSVSPTATAAPQRLHGVFIGAEKNGIAYVYCYAYGAMVHCEPFPVAELDGACEHLEDWLDAKFTRRPPLALVK